MSDVPVAAFWLLAIVAACDPSWKGALGAGLAASVAILIRPNLAPLVAPLVVWAFLWPAAARPRARAMTLSIAEGEQKVQIVSVTPQG